ncbi:ornithine carbamoyltransferase [Streptomyces sp. CdTB01]|uniref:ornithine carbamoyltransferase n=1 Tax=Streptomyces sp. CdTB01 TaxID=1725411 RepID=UPI00099E881B|nr:ornithine carbamoyltransferase [Streptomyces sp. CdTB01]
MRHLISLDDLGDTDLESIAARGVQFRHDPAVAGKPLDGQIVGTYFRKTSTRTRTAFSAAALRLGAQVLAYGPGDLQLNTGETIADTGRVFSGMLDLLVARTAGDPLELREFAAPGGMSVVNAMTADEHPTQALADLTTLLDRFSGIEDLRVLYVGEGNNSAVALALALSRFSGVRLELRTPPGYGLPEGVLARAERQAGKHGASVLERNEPPAAGLAGEFDVVYTTRWQTTGTSKPDPRWREVFAPFQVDERLWDGGAEALFMHDLPAHRGEEVSAHVLDGERSIAFDQAENKMHSAMAVLEWVRSERP